MDKEEKLLPVLSSTSTPCRDCVFAKYDGETQTGCLAGDRVDKFREAGVEVLEAYDDEKEFFIIKDKVCLYYRNVARHEDKDKKQKDELFSDIKSSLRIPYHTILFFRTKDELGELRDRLTELESQAVKPHLVTVIDRSHLPDKRSGDIMRMLHSDFSFNHWRVQEVSAIDQLDDDTVDICYDTTKKHKYFFYTIFETSEIIPATFSEEIHEAIHEKMHSFSYLSPNKSGIGKTVLKAAHEKYAGNSFGIELKDKINHYNDSVSLIKKVEDLCPSLKR